MSRPAERGAGGRGPRRRAGGARRSRGGRSEPAAPRGAEAAPEEAASEPAAAPRPAPADARRWRGFVLSPFQLRAVEAIESGHDVLLSAPTGAGKTLVAEYAIVDAVRRGRRCIYTAPIKALSNQKFRDFHADPDLDVGLLTGDVTINPGGRVLVMTTEILRNAIFEDPASLHDVEFVVFDEVHYMDDPERGTVWEESLIFAPPSIRFVCLSATVANLAELGAWLEEIRPNAVEIVSSELRPVPLHQRLWAEPMGAFEPGRLAEARRRAIAAGRGPQRDRSGGGRRGRGRGRDRERGRRRGGFDPTRPPAPGQLFDRLDRDALLPALVFSFSRRDCERLAMDNQHRELLEPAEVARIVTLQHELIARLHLPPEAFDSALFEMTRRGVGYHHAGMLPTSKDVVERLFTAGLLRLLFTTETFALGINMPARTVVFHSLKKFDGETFDYMRTRDFLQMAGRAGRQGLDDEGLVYTLLSAKDLFEAPLRRLLEGSPEPVESRFRLSFSSILHLVDRLGRERVHEAWQKSFNQFQHRDAQQKQSERNRRDQSRAIEAHIAFLDELGYLDGDELTPRGEVARKINGFELQVTELLFRGVLENLPPAALAVVFVGLIHEERRRFEPVRVSSRVFGDLRRQVDQVVRELVSRSFSHPLPLRPKRPDWTLSPAVLAWMEGRSFEELEERVDKGAGDLCRSFRMGVQLMRQTRRAIDPDWDLHHHLGLAMEAMRRDEVDARRELELD